MTIQSIGPSSTFGSTAKISGIGNSSNTSSDDSEIQTLQDEKENIQKQISEIKASDNDSETKQKLTKTLESQITGINAEIQQKQLAKAKQKVESAVSSQGSSKSDVSNETGNTHSNKDSVQISNISVTESALKLMDTYDKFGKLISMSKSAKNKAASLNSDAKLQDNAGSKTSAGKLYAEGAEMSARADGELSSAVKEAATANKESATVASDVGALANANQQSINGDKDKTGSIFMIDFEKSLNND